MRSGKQYKGTQSGRRDDSIPYVPFHEANASVYGALDDVLHITKIALTVSIYAKIGSNFQLLEQKCRAFYIVSKGQ